jgi:signal transduction histidine kinase
LTLTVSDNGLGFVARGHSRSTDSHGLVGMRERAKLLGGRLELRSRPGRGTRVVARVPVVKEDAA